MRAVKRSSNRRAAGRNVRLHLLASLRGKLPREVIGVAC
jgi:hypothetical protein